MKNLIASKHATMHCKLEFNYGTENIPLQLD